MTAIYTVWNNYGFAIAADSNQTATQKNQNWVDPVEKIITLKNHQIAFGSAGQAFFYNVEINEIIRSWELTLESDQLRSLEDYFLDFIFWLSKQKFSEETFESFAEDGSVTREFFVDNFTTLKEIYGEDIFKIEAEELLIQFFNNNTLTRGELNIFAGSWENLSNKDELDPLTQNDDMAEAQDRIYLKLQNLVHNDSDQSKSQYFPNEMVCIDKYSEEIFSLAEDSFIEVFNTEFDTQNGSHMTLLTILIDVLLSKMENSPAINMIMVGYGREDWHPSSVSFGLDISILGVPKVRISDISNPDRNWYVALGIETAVRQLVQGHTDEREDEIFEIAKPHLKKDHQELFKTELFKLRFSRFHSSLEKLNFLTLDRLEFISRSFVQIEALNSYLGEPVPGVGGDTKVITMSKTTKRERIFTELA